MKGKDSMQGIVDHSQAMWADLPRSRQVVETLGKPGMVHVITPTTSHMPTPPPTPEPEPTGPQARSFDPVDSSDRYANEVPGIGPKHTRHLTQGGIGSLAALAAAVPKEVAQILSVSEVKAMGFIDKAGRLLQRESGND